MGVVSSRCMWVESMGVVVRRYILPHITYPYSSCICSFLQQHPYFCIFLNIFRSCSSTFLYFNFMHEHFFHTV